MQSHDQPPQNSHRGPEITRRDFLLGLTGAVAVFNTTETLDNTIAERRWPDRPMAITPVEYLTGQEAPHSEVVVFGGYGQSDSINAAKELYLESDRTRRVMSTEYPNHDAEIAELAEPFLDHCRTYDVKELHLVGVSMGLHTMMLIMKYLHATYPDAELPVLRSITAYSSPANISDVKRLKAAKFIYWFNNLLKNRFMVSKKAGYSMFDGEGDARKVLTGDLRHIFGDSLRQTLNDTSPALGQRGLRELMSLDFETDWHQFEGIIGPHTKFTYVQSSGGDATIETATAFAKLSAATQKLGVSDIRLVTTKEEGHADTAPSARALAREGLLAFSEYDTLPEPA